MRLSSKLLSLYSQPNQTNETPTSSDSRAKPEAGSRTSETLALSVSRASSEAGSRTSAESFGSGYSFKSHASWTGRKGRKRKLKVVANPKVTRGQDFTKDTLSERDCQCTWCWKPFRKASDWKRHEESLHAPQTEWVCLAEGPETWDGLVRQCAMCNDLDPTLHHALDCPKQISRCIYEPLVNRTFGRKDHLVQHLRYAHGIQGTDTLPLRFSHWQQPRYNQETAPLWDCGFCSHRGMTWNTRYVHILGHKRKPNFSWDSWRKCVCCTRGYSPRLQPVLDFLGVGHSFTRLCQHYCPCGYLAGNDSRCGRAYFTKQGMERHGREITSHRPQLEQPCLYAREYSTLFARVPFWCGFCESIVPGSGNSAYECLFMHHVDRENIMKGHTCDSWKPLDLYSLERFLENIAVAVRLAPMPIPLGNAVQEDYTIDLMQRVIRFYRENLDPLGILYFHRSTAESLIRKTLAKHQD